MQILFGAKFGGESSLLNNNLFVLYMIVWHLLRTFRIFFYKNFLLPLRVSEKEGLRYIWRGMDWPYWCDYSSFLLIEHTLRWDKFSIGLWSGWVLEEGCKGLNLIPVDKKKCLWIGISNIFFFLDCGSNLIGIRREFYEKWK